MFTLDFNFIKFAGLGKIFPLQGEALNMDHFQIYWKIHFCALFMGQLFSVPA